MERSEMRKLSPLLTVEAIEPCLSFWVERLGFAKTVEVPDGASLGFVILAKDGVEIMYQSRASVAKDIPPMMSGSNLFSRPLRTTSAPLPLGPWILCAEIVAKSPY